MLYFNSICVVLVSLTISMCNSDINSKLPPETQTAYKFPPCQACKVLVDSFKKGIELTARSNFEGGDTAWEEKMLNTYALSEVRFVEIEEKLCSDIERGRDQCHSLAEEAEQHLEQWWFKEQNSAPDLIQWLCVDKMEMCCPNGHYGPECKPCVGYPDRICNNNGKCKGNGTRKGNGLCTCDEGYTGKSCHQCETTYYISYQDNNKLLCSKCHSSCENGCTQAGSKGCLACKPGWIMDSDRGCSDINECIAKASSCKTNEFCINTEGSFSCLACDPACNGCHGDGPDMCEQCADGFVLHNKMCVDKKNFGSNFQTARYLTYLGLCVATCIIFQKNPILASIIGVCVAFYVSMSMYMLKDMSLSFLPS